MKTPYIGITDFSSYQQVEEAISVFNEARKEQGDWAARMLMIGIMTSYKVLNSIPSKWADAWPVPEEISSIFRRLPGAFNTIHYADYDMLITMVRQSFPI